MRDDADDLAAIRDSVRALCADFPGEYWRALDREREYPSAFVDALTKAGFLAALIPEQYGGSGLSMRAAAAIMEEIHASGCNGAACHAQMYTMGTVLRHGSDAQKRDYLPAIARGELRLQAFGVTEPTSGTDTLSLRTTATRDGDDYIINGQKIWTSRAEYSDLMLLLARTTPRDQVQKRTDGLSVLLIDMRAVKGKGLDIRPIRTMMNHATTEVFFDNMRVPASSLIGEEGRGFRYILSGMNAERILIAAECIGDAKWFIAKASAYAKDRNVFGRPIGQNQGVQFPIARAYAQMRAAELMVREAAERYESGADIGEEANIAKLLAADASWAAADMCVQTFGGFGFAEDYDIERKFRETRLYQVAPISTNLILSYIAEHVLGLPRSYCPRRHPYAQGLGHIDPRLRMTESIPPCPSQPPTSSACSISSRIPKAGIIARPFATAAPTTPAAHTPPRSISCWRAASVRTGTRWTQSRPGTGMPAHRSSSTSTTTASARNSSWAAILRPVNGHKALCQRMPGRPRSRWATGRWSAAPSRRALSFPASNSRLRAGRRHKITIENALGACP